MYVHSVAIQAIAERAVARGSSEILLDYELCRNEYAQDIKFNNEVREASCEILLIAIKLGEGGELRHCPVRVYLRIVSASIFLLKSISLGARNSDLLHSLSILDRCNQALQCTRQDDMHLSARYGQLIARHVRRFKKNFRVQARLNTPLPTASGLFSKSAEPMSKPLDNQTPALDPTITTDAANNSLETFAFDIGTNVDDWLAQPFDPSIAPFGIEQSGSGLAIDSLDFLWNLPV